MKSTGGETKRRGCWEGEEEKRGEVRDEKEEGSSTEVLGAMRDCWSSIFQSLAKGWEFPEYCGGIGSNSVATGGRHFWKASYSFLSKFSKEWSLEVISKYYLGGENGKPGPSNP